MSHKSKPGLLTKLVLAAAVLFSLGGCRPCSKDSYLFTLPLDSDLTPTQAAAKQKQRCCELKARYDNPNQRYKEHSRMIVYEKKF